MKPAMRREMIARRDCPHEASPVREWPVLRVVRIFLCHSRWSMRAFSVNIHTPKAL